MPDIHKNSRTFKNALDDRQSAALFFKNGSVVCDKVLMRREITLNIDNRKIYFV